MSPLGTGTPPVVERCVGCGHPAHPGRECGIPAMFTHTCTCPRVYDPARDRPRPAPDFDERTAFREHDEEWYPDDRD